ncbi:CRPV-019 [Crowpox virus]|nr:CRPV-019 [Crowpox virus]
MTERFCTKESSVDISIGKLVVYKNIILITLFPHY